MHLIDEWTLELQAANYRPRTIKDNRIMLRSLQRRAEKPATQITRKDLLVFLARPELSGSTRQHYRATVRQFFAWMQDEGHRDDNPATRLPKVHVLAKEPHPVKTPDIELLLRSVYFVTRVKILLYAYQGMRASELAAIRGEHLDLAKGVLHIPDGKGGKEAWVPLHPLVAEVARKMPPDGYWFPSPMPGYEDTHVRGQSVSRTISDAMKRAGIAHKPHQLRAWFATEMLTAGTDSTIVQAAMRHTTIETLKRYARPTLAQTAHALAVLPIVHVPTRVDRRAA